MANQYSTLNSLFTAIADSIRLKKNSAKEIIADNFPTEIDSLRTGFDYSNQNVTTIPDYAFYDCEDLNNVDCYNLANIGASAFENCTNLKSVVLYDNVESVGENAFKGCDNVVIYCESQNITETWHENWNPDNRPVLCGEPINTWDISDTEDDNVIAQLYLSLNNKYVLFISGHGNARTFVKSQSSTNIIAERPWDSYMSNIVAAVFSSGISNVS